MKKTGLMVCLAIIVMFLAAPVFADTVVFSDKLTKPWTPASDEAWLESLDSLNGIDLTYIGQDVTVPFGDVLAPGWLYAVVTYDLSSPRIRDHWAIGDDGDFVLELAGLPLPGNKLGHISHVSWFGTTTSINDATHTDDDPTASVPEPLTALLIGFGLVGWAGVRSIRRRFR